MESNFCKNNIKSNITFFDSFLPKSYLQEKISIVLARAGIGSAPYNLLIPASVQMHTHPSQYCDNIHNIVPDPLGDGKSAKFLIRVFILDGVNNLCLPFTSSEFSFLQ